MRDHSLAHSSGSLPVKFASTDSTSSRLARRKILRLPVRSRTIALISSRFLTRPMDPPQGVQEAQAVPIIRAVKDRESVCARFVLQLAIDFKLKVGEISTLILG